MKTIRMRTGIFIIVCFLLGISMIKAQVTINPPPSSSNILQNVTRSSEDIANVIHNSNLDATGSSISIRLNKKGDSLIVHNNEKIVIEPTEVISDELIVLGGHLSILGKVKNDVIVFGGHASVSGTIDGDLVVMAGNVNLANSAKVLGNLVTFGGNLDIEDGAYIQEDEVNLSSFPFVSNLGSWVSRNIDEPESAWDISPLKFLNTFSSLWWLLVSFFAVLLVSRNLEEAGKIVKMDALKSLLVGFLFHLATLMIMTFLILTLIGIPLTLVVVIFWVAVNLFAVPLGFYVLGACILEKFNRPNPSIPGSMALGFVILSLTRFLPFFIGFFIWHLWMMAAIGATITSKFGTLKPWFRSQTYRRPPGAYPPPPFPDNTKIDIMNNQNITAPDISNNEPPVRGND